MDLQIETQKFIQHVRENYDPSKPLVFWIDLFCGAGGTSTGIHLANAKNVFVAACVNHWFKAIKTHMLNHPNTLHFTEDITDFNVVRQLQYLVDELRKEFPNCKIKIWASLECTNFSKAKGGQPRNADSRSLAEHMPMYMALNPDVFWFENVREFMAWGPLDENGKPISNKNGIDYLAWIDRMKSFGYNFDYKILNAADYGSCQSRERLFIQFPKKGIPFSWPEQTHSKKGSDGALFDIPKWKPVKEILDFENLGNSIFERKKPLSDKTIDVIMKGLVKVMNEKEFSFMHGYYGNGDNYYSINNPSGTLTTKDRFALFTIIFNQYKTGNTSSPNTVIGSATTVPKNNILTFIMNPSHGGHCTLTDNSSPTVIARQDKAPLYLLSAIMEKYGIVDIKMRMLTIEELLQIQGFPKDYKLEGTKTEQKKQIGNAVDVNMAKALAFADYQMEVKIKNVA